mmetsp:Transcript_17301/g.47957  ORF Transcript_17301/g.47957 Transcript_17301/m.47957 type:complete len:527 (+) Transcript_17301:52-1632(+)
MQVTLSGSLSGAGCSAPAAAPMRTVLLPPVSALPNVLPNQRLPLSASSQGSCGCGKNGLKHCVAATAGWQWEGMSNSSSSNSSSRTRVVAASSSRASALRFEADEDSHTDTQQQLEAGLQQIIRDNRPEALGQNGLGASSNGDTQGNAGPAASGGNSTAHLQAAAAAASSTAPQEPKYKTVMLKVSGEALMGPHGFGVDPQVLLSVAEEVAAATQAGVRIAIVVGGGNFFRGANSLEGLERATGDYVGMLATVMNALCLQSALEKVGVETRVQTAIEMREVAEPYIRRRAISHLQEGRVVIFGAGTGNPFFTTDTAAALRAAEVNAEVFLKATKVDGVYDSDPFKNPNARRYDQLSYRQVCFDSLNVMDETAITLCKENNIPVIVFNIMEKGNIRKASLGLPVGTVVDNTTPWLAHDPASAQPSMPPPPLSSPSPSSTTAAGSPPSFPSPSSVPAPSSSHSVQGPPSISSHHAAGAGAAAAAAAGVGGHDLNLGKSIAAFRQQLGESLGETSVDGGSADPSGECLR